ncbi:MAG: hypothetical protein Q7U10_11935 [Thermodesulfovibrionia bacterium]|nr:hypothetical protein [Thermodesulfovibrionia bacterium]
MKKTVIVLTAITILFTFAGNALPGQLIDLSTANSATYIKVPGASFAQIFKGETLSGAEVVGAPSNPLTLSPLGDLIIEPLGTVNTIVPDINYNGPLSVILDSDATFISFVMGHAESPISVKIDFFASDGSLVHSVDQQIYKNYNTYYFKDLGVFRGLTIYCNDDPAGLRFYNFKYENNLIASGN